MQGWNNSKFVFHMADGKQIVGEVFETVYDENARLSVIVTTDNRVINWDNVIIMEQFMGNADPRVK